MILLSSSGVNTCYIGVDKSWAAISDRHNCQDELGSTTKPPVKLQRKYQQYQAGKFIIVEGMNLLPAFCEPRTINSQMQGLELFDVAYTGQISAKVSQSRRLIAQSNLTSTDNPNSIQQVNESPQLEGQPSNFPQSSPKPIEPLLDAPPNNNTENIEKLRQRLREIRQPTSTESNSVPELGLRVRQRTLPPPKIEQPTSKFKPIGSLQGRIGYFQTDNIFSSDIDPIEDGLLFYGLRLSSAYLPLGSQTFLNGSIDGNLIRYVNQSKFNYNQLVFNLGVYQQLSKRMYGQISLSNQQLFYANSSDRFQSGDRFLNENSLRLSLGRRDPLAEKLMLDSFYEFSLNIAEPDSRNRVINSLWLSLNYQLQEPLEVGLDYQLNLSDFTERDRNDQYHRLFGRLSYRLSNSSNLNAQAGISFGDSTDKRIDYNTWFFNINYNLELGKF